MNDFDKLDIISINLYRPFVEMLLRSLELYAYNLHYIVKQSSEDYVLYNIYIKYAYQELLKSLDNYNVGYNCSYNCDLAIQRSKKRNFYKYKKNVA